MSKFTKSKVVLGSATAAAIALGLFQDLWHEQEGYKLVAYQDSIGIWTICEGDTSNVTAGTVETPEGCKKRSDRITRGYFASIPPLLKAEFTYGQWIAYADFAGNAGLSNFKKSSMLKYANKGMLRESCDAFRLWVYAGGNDCRQFLSNCGGIVSRREIERRYCRGELP